MRPVLHKTLRYRPLKSGEWNSRHLMDTVLPIKDVKTFYSICFYCKHTFFRPFYYLKVFYFVVAKIFNSTTKLLDKVIDFNTLAIGTFSYEKLQLSSIVMHTKTNFTQEYFHLISIILSIFQHFLFFTFFILGVNAFLAYAARAHDHDTDSDWATTIMSKRMMR